MIGLKVKYEQQIQANFYRPPLQFISVRRFFKLPAMLPTPTINLKSNCAFPFNTSRTSSSFRIPTRGTSKNGVSSETLERTLLQRKKGNDRAIAIYFLYIHMIVTLNGFLNSSVQIIATVIKL